MESKKLLFILTLFILLSFVSGAEGDSVDYSSEFGLDEGEILASGIEFSEIDGVKTFNFVEENARLEIKDNVFENIKSEGDAGHPTYIRLNAGGEVLEAEFTSKGGTYLIQGLEFEVPEGSRVYYTKEGGFEFSEKNVNIKKLEFNEEPYRIQSLETMNIEDKFNLKGSFLVDEKGFTSDFGSFEYNGVLVNGNSFDAFGFGEVLVVKDSSVDLSGYEGSWIREDSGKLTVKSFSQGTKISLDFSEENPYLDLSLENLEPHQEKKFSIVVSEDELELISGEKVEFNHKGTSSGETIISNGRNTFKLSESEFSHTPGETNTKNFVSVPMSVSSEAFDSGTLFIYEDNGYVVRNSEGENIITFDKSQFGNPDYVFESAVGEKIHSFAEDQIANAGYVWNGRLTEKNPGLDCIGVAICAINLTYPDLPFRTIPPDLTMVSFLEEKKNWNSQMIDPVSIIGSETREKIKNIPAGSVVFSLEEVGSESGLTGEGLDYIKYTNEKGEKKIIRVKHTLIKGKGEISFINAIPSQEINSRVAREYNEYLISQGKNPLFTGEVREAELVPNNRYLWVISPPKD